MEPVTLEEGSVVRVRSTDAHDYVTLLPLGKVVNATKDAFGHITLELEPVSPLQRQR